MKRLNVIGTLVWDRIWHPAVHGDRPLEQWGGIAYSLSALSAVAPRGWTIVPMLRVGADLADRAIDFLRSLPGISLDSLVIVPEANNRVDLRYHDSADRSERLSGGVSPWSVDELLQHLEAVDAIYVNFISGFEFDLAAAERLKRLPVPIYSDLHSLFLEAPGERARPARRLPEWERWLRCFDAVQLNEAELSLLGPPREDPFDLLPALPAFGPGLVLVTRGSRGVAYATRPGTSADPTAWPEQRLISLAEPASGERVKARPARPRDATVVEIAGRPLAGDPTGCGDIWGSVLFAGLLEGLPLDHAIRRAHAAAEAKLLDGRMPVLRSAIARATGASAA